MTQTVLWPRLSAVWVSEVWSRFTETGMEDEREIGAEKVSWGSSGGRRITPAELKQTRVSVVEVAKSCGFPSSSTQEQRAEFDARCSVLLFQAPMPVGEALRDDIWSYVSAVLLPDVCMWRFPDPPLDRVIGGVRNTFQRLWLRAHAFDRGESHPKRWELLSILSEDAMVQIIERPLLASDSRVALAIAECWNVTSERLGRQRMESLTRNAVRAIRLRNEVIYLAAVDAQGLVKSVLAHFQAAERDLEMATRGSGLPRG